MRTSVMKIDETVVLVSKFDNSDDRKAHTIDELESYVDGIIDNYNVEEDEEEALHALMQGLRAATENLEEGTILSF